MHDLHGKIRGVRSEGISDRDGLDAAEGSEIDIQDEIAFALIQMKAETLKRIDTALRRIAAGDYGDCFECGGKIAEVHACEHFHSRCVAKNVKKCVRRPTGRSVEVRRRSSSTCAASHDQRRYQRTRADWPSHKIVMDTRELSLVAANDIGAPGSVEYLLKYDTVYGRDEKPVQATHDGHLKVGDHRLRLLRERDPARLPWTSLNVDIVFECTGVFSRREDLESHIQVGAEYVILSAPSRGDGVETIVHRSECAIWGVQP